MAKAIIDPEFMDDTTSSGVDGDLVKYAVEYSSMGVVNPNIIENSALSNDLMGDEFYGAGGQDNVGGDDFYDATSDDIDTFAEDSMPDTAQDPTGEDYSNLTLVNKKKRQKFKQGLKKFGQNAGKLGLAALTAKGAAGRQPAPMPPPAPEPTKTGWAALSGGAKAAIVISGVAVLGTIAYLVMSKKK